MRLYKRKFKPDGTKKNRPPFADSKKRHIEREKTRKTAKILQEMALNCRQNQPELAKNLEERANALLATLPKKIGPGRPSKKSKEQADNQSTHAETTHE